MGSFTEMAGRIKERRPEGHKPPEPERKQYNTLRAHDEARDRWANQALKMAEATQKSEHLRRQIMLAVNAGKPAPEVLLLALECIALITGDNVIYEQNRRTLENPAYPRTG